jgi:hypothetical protein
LGTQGVSGVEIRVPLERAQQVLAGAVIEGDGVEEISVNAQTELISVRDGNDMNIRGVLAERILELPREPRR